MNSLRSNFFLMYAVAGSLQQLMPLFLERERGFTKPEVGRAMAFAQATVFVAPLLCTWLADARVAPRRLMSGIYLLLAAAATAVFLLHGAVVVAILNAAIYLLFAPVVPLQDALVFGANEQRVRDGHLPIAYQKLRVWGTIGFIAPTLILWPLLEKGMHLDVMLAVGVAFTLIAFVNTFFLPDVRPVEDAGEKRSVPTIDALRVFAEPRILLFALLALVANAAIAAWSTFFPSYLEETVGVDRALVAPLNNLGVLIEIVWMLALGRLTRKFGLRGVMLFGAWATVVRFSLLVWTPNLPVVVATQFLHGIMVLFIFVAPQLYLNAEAKDTYRASIQGVYAVFFAGAGRVLGNYIAAPFAGKSLGLVYGAAAVAMTVVALLLPFAFRSTTPGAVRESSPRVS